MGNTALPRVWRLDFKGKGQHSERFPGPNEVFPTCLLRMHNASGRRPSPTSSKASSQGVSKASLCFVPAGFCFLGMWALGVASMSRKCWDSSGGSCLWSGFWLHWSATGNASRPSLPGGSAGQAGALLMSVALTASLRLSSSASSTRKASLQLRGSSLTSPEGLAEFVEGGSAAAEGKPFGLARLDADSNKREHKKSPRRRLQIQPGFSQWPSPLPATTPLA